MRVLGSATIPVVFKPEDVVHPIPVRIVHALPYGFILGARFFRTNRSILDFEHLKGFKPTPGSPWIPFLDKSSSKPRDHASWRRFCVLTEGNPSNEVDITHPHSGVNKDTRSCPSPDTIAFEDDMTLQWLVRLTSEQRGGNDSDPNQSGQIEIPGYVSRSVQGRVSGPRPQGQQLVLLLPVEKYDLDKGALVGLARGVQWWRPGTPVTCKLVNRGNLPGRVPIGSPIARLIAMNTRDAARFDSLFHHGPSTTDPPHADTPPHAPMAREGGSGESTPVRVEDANYGQLGVQQKWELEELLQHFIDRGLFPTDPKRVPACVGGELALPLIDEGCTPVAERQRSFTPEEVDMIRLEISKLTERGVIRPSNSQWAAQVICVRKSDGTLRLCVDWRKLNVLLESDVGASETCNASLHV